jgi:hypothetical protein
MEYIQPLLQRRRWHLGSLQKHGATSLEAGEGTPRAENARGGIIPLEVIELESTHPRAISCSRASSAGVNTKVY